MNKHNESSIPNTKFTRTLSKGCGCFSIFLVFFFALGMVTLYKDNRSTIEIPAIIEEYVEIERGHINGAYVYDFAPVVAYEYEGKKYRDTLNVVKKEINPTIDSLSIQISIHPDNPDVAIENESNYYYFYAFILLLASISYLFYRILKGPKKQLFNTTSHSNWASKKDSNR